MTVPITIAIAMAAPLTASAAQNNHDRAHARESRAHRMGAGTRLSAGGIPVSITFRPYVGSTRAFLDVGTGEHPCPHLGDPELLLPLGNGRTLSVRFYRRGFWLISRTAVARLPIGSSFRFTRCDRRASVQIP